MIREPVVTGTTSVTRILTASRHFCCPLLPRVTRYPSHPVGSAEGRSLRDDNRRGERVE